MWSNLVSEGKPGVNPAEFEKLAKLLKHYEAENLRLKTELEASGAANKAMVGSLGDADKVRQELVRKIKAMEKEKKFDKIAADGIAKRASAFEFDATNLKEERKTLVEEQILNRAKVAYLEESLNNDRAKLLQEMHECDLLRKQVETLNARVTTCEQELIVVRSEALSKLQTIETLSSRCESQQRVITSQSEEILEVTSEVTAVKENQRLLNELVLQQQQVITEKHRDRDDFETEVWRLRKELMAVSLTKSERSLAHSHTYAHAGTQQSYVRGNTGSGSRNTSVSRLSTAAMTATLNNGSSHFGSLNSNSNVSMSMNRIEDWPVSQASIPQQYVVSPKSAPFRPHSLSLSHDQNISQNQSNNGSDVNTNFNTYSNTIGSGSRPVTSMAGMLRTTNTANAIADSEQSTSTSPKPLQFRSKSVNNNKHSYCNIQSELSRTSPAALSLSLSPSMRPGSSAFSCETDADETTTVTVVNPIGNHNHNPHQSLPQVGTVGAMSQRLPGLRGARSISMSTGNGNGRDNVDFNNNVDGGIHTNTALEQPRQGTASSSNRMSTRTSKTKYVGSGLGLKHDDEPAFSPKGSAKQVLKKIMDDFNRNA